MSAEGKSMVAPGRRLRQDAGPPQLSSQSSVPVGICATRLASHHSSGARPLRAPSRRSAVRAEGSNAVVAPAAVWRRQHGRPSWLTVWCSEWLSQKEDTRTETPCGGCGGCCGCFRAPLETRRPSGRSQAVKTNQTRRHVPAELSMNWSEAPPTCRCMVTATSTTDCACTCRISAMFCTVCTVAQKEVSNVTTN